jgi:MoaA/NifB/PqqE/SkfB family radical SAM enzyme
MIKKTYDKANSILELRGIRAKRNRILEILEAQKRSYSIDDDPVLGNALKDLLVKENVEETSEEKFFLRDHVVEEMSRLHESEFFRYLRYRYSYDVYPAIKKTTKFPPLVQIEPSSICNYRCVFCYQTDKRLTNKKSGHMGMMDLDLFKNIIDQLEGNVEGITLASRGEPSLNKQLPNMLQYLSGKFLATKINTNAYLFNESLCHSILEANIQTLVFSADAASEPLYSKLRVNGNLDRVLKNIEQFNELKEKHFPNSKLITRVSGVKFNKEQNMSEMESFWKHLVDQVAFVDYNPWENVYDAEKNGIESPCSDLWRRLFVWWDGRVCPCDVDYLTTLSKERFPNSSLSEIWQGQTFSNLRKRHLSKRRKDLDPCSRCVVV